MTEVNQRPQAESMLAGVARLLSSPLAETLPALADVARGVLPLRGLLLYSGDCVAQPVRWYGDVPTGPAVVTAMTQLARTMVIGESRADRVTMGDNEVNALSLASAPAGSAGSVLACVLPDTARPDASATRLLQLLWEITAQKIVVLNARIEPAKLAQSRIASSDRARIVAELTDAHAATLTTMLGALRSAHLADSTARRVATDIGATALVELRTSGDEARSAESETVSDAFAQMADKLVLLMRYHDAELDLSAPKDTDHILPSSVAIAARSLARGAAMTMLAQPSVSRIRVAWEVTGARLHVQVRDDGPGTLAADDFAIRRLAMSLAAVDAPLEVDSVPGWGTTLTATIPLRTAGVPAGHPLEVLNPREIDVLHQLTLGHRNRRIAQELHISEHTVKYHVANILDKLGVGSRGEAAAMARHAGFAPVTSFPNSATRVN
ncbi:LuxR C-terminal-related transcriptional regulator [Hoyosella sp. YIM 151337]|uniref:helix-turn-helix transcriptional regulator n=1 Tax=Hoyosella sp. YIM 151337 TaxID=2992742 RepID=UPI0022364E49|nr:LuxR C-terminal-related transcriptional regulator [Hoyosella sp. YIM 151337]MCW4353002.1 LuxR C-terminal-related transcriptional regulator [Hoyosella sp. YIM 151337]